MSPDIARTCAALAREIESLEECLASDANWQALRAAEIQTGLSMPPYLDSGAALALPESLRTALKRNPVFLARARLYEALEFLLDPGLTSYDGPPPVAAADAPAAIEDPQTAPDGLTLIEGITPATGVAADNDREPLRGAPVDAPVDASQRIRAALARLAESARLSSPPMRDAPAGTERPSTLYEPAAAVMPEPPLTATKAVAATSTMRAVVDEDGDDLRHIAFIDDRVAAQLNASGILRFSDIAHFTVDQVAVLSVRLGLGNRIAREQWIEQASVLAAGRTTAYVSQVRSAAGSSASAIVSEADKPEPADFDFASLDRSGQACPPAARPEKTPPDVPSAVVVPPAPWQTGSEELVVPPPLPPVHEDLPPLLAPEDQGASFGDDANAFAAEDCTEVSDVWIVPRLTRAIQIEEPPPIARVGSQDVFTRHQTRENGPLLRDPLDWVPIEEAAVEIVPHSAPFPGVGPVSEAVTRLQSAVEPPAPAFSRLLRAFQRR